MAEQQAADTESKDNVGCGAQLGGLLILAILLAVLVQIGQCAGCIEKSKPVKQACERSEAACDQAREQCLTRATKDKNDCIMDCETSMGSNIAMIRCAKRCGSNAFNETAHCYALYKWNPPPPAEEADPQNMGRTTSDGPADTDPPSSESAKTQSLLSPQEEVELKFKNLSNVCTKLVIPQCAETVFGLDPKDEKLGERLNPLLRDAKNFEEMTACTDALLVICLQEAAKQALPEENTH